MENNKFTYSMVISGCLALINERRGGTNRSLLAGAGIPTGTWSRITRGQAHFQIEQLRAGCGEVAIMPAMLTTFADGACRDLVLREGLEWTSDTGARTVPFAALCFLIGKLGY